ncbi:hypothetical protein STEG23_001929 [Scotinomys teguina]
MALLVKGLAAKLEDLSLIPRTYEVDVLISLLEDVNVSETIVSLWSKRLFTDFSSSTSFPVLEKADLAVWESSERAHSGVRNSPYQMGLTPFEIMFGTPPPIISNLWAELLPELDDQDFLDAIRGVQWAHK